MQNAFDALIKLFKYVGLWNNTLKTKAMTCVPGKDRTRLLTTSYNNMHDGLCGRYKGHNVLVDCVQCGKFMLKICLPQHRETQHKIYRSLVIDKALLVERGPVTYQAGTTILEKLFCPVLGCVGGGSTAWNLQQHFSSPHTLDLICTPTEGLYPWCNSCGIQVRPWASDHRSSAFSVLMSEKREQHAAAVESVSGAYLYA